MTGEIFIDIKMWDLSGQEMKSQLQISSSLGGILNDITDVDMGVCLTSSLLENQIH